MGLETTRPARSAAWWVICALSIGCASAAAEPPTPTHEVVVRVAEVRQARVRPSVFLHGRTRATDRATASFVVGGRLVERRVDVGDRVSAGQTLARLDARGYAHGVEAASASLAELEARRAQLARDETRLTTLREGGVVAAADLESVRTAVARVDESQRAARVALEEARRQRDESVLRAPFDGVVRAVLVDEGTVVAPGTPVFLLAGEGPTEVELEVPERVVAWARVGDRVDVELPSTGERFVGEVVALADAASPTGLFPARARLQTETPIASGRGTLVTWRGAEAATELRVPLAAVVDPSGDRPFVWRVDAEGRAERVEVRPLALRDDETSEVALAADGLAVGDEVVVAGHGAVLPGDLVRRTTETSR
ncbi:MAG: efflux RND transporter periplasmic adaptor subunit [Sandaracinus sp.]|nr:efflux RND transporter periplasmic adaptor subunit [Sandaracinus sp.]